MYICIYESVSLYICHRVFSATGASRAVSPSLLVSEISPQAIDGRPMANPRTTPAVDLILDQIYNRFQKMSDPF